MSGKGGKKCAHAAHTAVNEMSDNDVMFFIADMKRVFDPSRPVRGRKRHIKPTSLQFRIKVDPAGDIWLNPAAFSWTKQKRVGAGYPTMPFRKQSSKQAKKSASRKAPSFARILVHAVMWRFHNGFQKIPSGKEVSHLTGVTAVGKPNLHVESGALNKHRIGCHARLFSGRSCRCGLEEEGVPFCRVKPAPDSGAFSVGDEQAALKALPSSQSQEGGDDVVQLAPVCPACRCPKRPASKDAGTLKRREVWGTCICEFLE